MMGLKSWVVHFIIEVHGRLTALTLLQCFYMSSAATTIFDASKKAAVKSLHSAGFLWDPALSPELILFCPSG